MTTLENNQQRKDKVYFYAACQCRQEPDSYTSVKDKSLPYCCEDCGFTPCICKRIVGYNLETGLFIVNVRKGELDNVR